jgi:hypothetical protein
MLFCPGMEPFGHRESSLFAERTENKSFSEKNPIFFSTKLEMIQASLQTILGIGGYQSSITVCNNFL